MLERSTRWLVAASIAMAMTAVGCARPAPPNTSSARDRGPAPIVEDQSVVHAFDTQIEERLLDRLQLDNFLRDRDIRLEVMDGLVSITGEVWTPLERERVSALIRGVPGVIGVHNDLAVRPPR
jgi:osmotically-inducible protein OsmY